MSDIQKANSQNPPEALPPSPPASPPASSADQQPAWVKRLGPLGVVALLLWKFKFIALAVLSKAKLLLFGLTKASTLFSMLLSMGAYWALYGWQFGVGLVLSIYVHEMGHVAALRRAGIPASAPMFIPGLGAFVRLGAHPATVEEDATVGLAGPIWGLAASLFCFAMWAFTDGRTSNLFGAIAHAAAWMNLFNLLPVWQLDGSRGMAALSRRDRGIIAAAFLIAWTMTSEGLLLGLAIASTVRLFGKDAPQTSNRTILLRFLFLILSLSYLVALPVAGRR